MRAVLVFVFAVPPSLAAIWYFTSHDICSAIVFALLAIGWLGFVVTSKKHPKKR